MFRFFSKNKSVDPIAEAEVYFAYGNMDKGIELLKKAYTNGDNELKEKINKFLSDKKISFNKY